MLKCFIFIRKNLAEKEINFWRNFISKIIPHEHIKNIRAETEEIRRENAKMFHIYKEKLGRKGNQLLEKLYFKDYPSLEHIENAIKNEPLLALKATGEYTDEEIFKMTDDQIDEIVKSKKFFQTELIDENDGDQVH